MSTLFQKGHLQAKVATIYSSWQGVVLLVITLEAAFCDTIGNTYLQQAGWAVLAEFICSLRFTGELSEQLHLQVDTNAVVPSSAMLYTPSEINPVQTSRGLNLDSWATSSFHFKLS